MNSLRQYTRFLPAALILFSVNALNYYDRHVAGALTEPIRREFHLSDAQIGLLTSAFIWIYAIVGVPLGLLADGWSRKKVLAWGVLLWTSMTAMAGWTGNFWTLLLTRMGVGVGEAACAPAATSWLAELCPEELRSRVLAIFMLGVPIGGALSFLFSGVVAQAFGWRAAMVLAAAPALILVPAILFVREPERVSVGAKASGISVRAVASILRLRTFWWIVLSGALFNFNGYVVAFFIPAFFSRTHHLPLRSATAAMAGIYLIGGIVGAYFGGTWGDGIAKRRKDGRMLLASLCTILAAPCALLGFVLSAGHFWQAFAFLVLMYGLMTPYFGLVYASLQDIVAPELRATAMAAYLLGMYVLGGSMGPLVIGMLSDRFARRAAMLAGSPDVAESFRAIGLQHALQLLPIVYVGLAVILYMGSRSIVRDAVEPPASVE